MEEKNGQLDQLFAELKKAESPDQVGAIQEEIWALWLVHPDPEAAALMRLGCDEMGIGDHNQAIRTFTELVKICPSYPEAWNKRATVYYMCGCFKKSLADIGRVLELEPRHFGAISGKATILRELGYFKATLKALLRLEQIVPYQRGLSEQIAEMRCKVRSGQ